MRYLGSTQMFVRVCVCVFQKAMCIYNDFICKENMYLKTSWKTAGHYTLSSKLCL